MMNRRNFMRNTALAAGVATVGTRWAPSLQASPYNKPIGLQLYTVREQLGKDVPGTIKKVAEIGYKQVEVYGYKEDGVHDFYGHTTAEFAQMLKDNGLTVPSAHYMLNHIHGNWEKTIEDAKLLGVKYMVNAILAPEERDWKKLVDVFNKAAEQTHKAGIGYCYHNHNFEFQKFGDSTPFEFLMKSLDPKLIQFEMDCFWVTHAGHDPVELFKKHPGRFPLLHIKDLKDHPPATQEFDARIGLFAEVGHGTIDWKRIFAAAPQGGMKYFYVEQDECEHPPFESIKMSFDYLKALTV